MIGKTLSHYKIREQIGAGGMGVVYRAQDERLERDVALKVLPSDALTDEEARKRFRKEALALSKLNHPNIATVFDFDHQEGVDFLVMEFIAGEPLAAKQAHGPLTEKEVVSLGWQISSALEEAHEHGVVHRDLKPGNVMVIPKGHVKVLDFGLAKLLRQGGDADATRSIAETKAVAGTLPYMAPEQLRNEPLDARTDLHALGAVLYEMATGKRVFAEDSAPRLTDAILHRSPVSARAMNPRISPELDRIILKCLEKDPENRYQSAKEVAVDLRRLAQPTGDTAIAAPAPTTWRGKRLVLAAGAAAVVLAALFLAFNVGGTRNRLLSCGGPPRIESIAVLPLENLSGDSSQEYFADGMTEALITELSQLSGLKKVTSRTSVMQFKQKNRSTPEIAKMLGVDAIIEGSVLREGDQVRITVQLIHGATDRHLWAQSFDRELRGILALHSEVAQAIAEEIKVALTPQERALVGRARPVKPEAYELYLRGHFQSSGRTPEGLKKGLEYFQGAINADPSYALGYIGLADSYLLLADYGVLQPSEGYPRAKVAVARALKIDDSLAEAHASLVQLSMRDWDLQAAEKEYRRALELNPNYPTAHHWYALFLSSLGRHEEAIREIKRAWELDPLASIIRGAEVMILFYARKYDRTIEACQKALELDPNFGGFHGWQGAAYLEKGMFDRGVAGFERNAVAAARAPHVLGRLGYAYSRAGRRAEAVKILRQLEELSKRQYVSSYDIALVHVGLGEKPQALAWLEKAYKTKEGAMWLAFLNVSPWFEILRSDQRFQDLLRRMNFPESSGK